MLWGLFIMSKYTVSNFFIEKISDKKGYIMNSANIAIIEDEKLLNLLVWIDSNKIQTLTTSTVKKFTNEDFKENIEFLKSHGIIRENFFDKSYSNIIYITNDRNAFSSLKFNMFEEKDTSDLIYFNTFDSLLIHTNNIVSHKKLIFFILNPFSITLLRKLRDFAKEKLFDIRVAFYYNFKFYITNIYSPTLLSPCPLCFFSNLESSLRTTNRFENNITFQNIIDIIYNEHARFKTYAEFSNMQLLHLVSYLALLDKREYFYNESYEISYDTGLINQDTSYHWELCDCYE